MKETKTFFSNNNRLNKGYIKISSPKVNDTSFYKKQFEHIMPPIDVICQYEEIEPGTFNKILDMAAQEQNHKHSLDLVQMEVYNRATKLGRLCSLAFILMICLTTLLLALKGQNLVAITLIITAFASLGLLSMQANKQGYERKNKYKNS